MKKITQQQKGDLLSLLETRFKNHRRIKTSIAWELIRERLSADDKKLSSIFWMEETGGEPEIIEINEKSMKLVIVDASPETPEGRRSWCYDMEALKARKKFPPENAVMEVAKNVGVSVLTEAQYLHLQTLGAFDLKTSSWIQTPSELRSKGGALFGDRRFDRVFIYHNSADSYYASRGFRAFVEV